MNFLTWVWNFFETWLQRCSNSYRKGHIVKAALVFLAVPFGAAGSIALFWVVASLLLRFVLDYWLQVLVIVGAPVGLVYFLTNRKKEPSPPPPPPTDIEAVRRRAENTYPVIKQTAYVLFTDLSRYLPGILPPFSLSAVTAPVNFDITASLVIIFHFMIAKGETDAPVATVKEILERLIAQHLEAHDLPLAIAPVYVASDGSTWPALAVDGVYDIGNTYRVDLVITNEAAVARLKGRGLSGTDDTTADPHDPDFS